MGRTSIPCKACASRAWRESLRHTHLTADASVGERHVASQLRRLQARPHRSPVPLQGDERTGVEHECHPDAAFALRGALLAAPVLRPRTTTASSRSARAWGPSPQP